MLQTFVNSKAAMLLVAATLTVSATGCKTIDAYTGEEKVGNTTKGAGIGAGIGAVIGYISARDKSRHDRRKAILAGAAVGGLTGAGVGAYMDKQEAELREKLQGTGVSVTRNGDDVILNMPGNITFATGSSSLNEGFTDVLKSVVLVLNEYDQTLIEVAGHTDSVGSEASNLQLSNQRAQTVSSYLTSKEIDPQRILTVGHGEERPIADNSTAAGRELNRRVELLLIPVTQE